MNNNELDLFNAAVYTLNEITTLDIKQFLYKVYDYKFTQAEVSEYMKTNYKNLHLEYKISKTKPYHRIYYFRKLKFIRYICKYNNNLFSIISIDKNKIVSRGKIKYTFQKMLLSYNPALYNKFMYCDIQCKKFPDNIKLPLISNIFKIEDLDINTDCDLIDFINNWK